MEMAKLGSKLLFILGVLFTVESVYGFRVLQPHELKNEEVDHLQDMFGLTFPDYITVRPFVKQAEIDDQGFTQSLERCKLSPRGLDFQGKVHYTASKQVCLNWKHPFLRKEMSKFHNKDFPDASIKAAKYYCRNPDNSSTPWCYRKTDGLRENCSIRYCVRPMCQFTGPGIEYTGNVSESIYGACEPWSLDAPLYFIEESNFTKPKHYMVRPYCRNPTYDPIGPYCYVYNYESNGTYRWLKKAYCDIPFCDTFKLTAVMERKIYLRKSGPFIFCVHGRNDGHFTHYTLIDSKQNHMNISFRLWHPDYLYKQDLRLALSALAIPATGVELVKWGVGFEIILSNNETGVIVNPYEDSIFIRVPKLMSGRVWKNLTIEWHQGQIYLRFTEAEEGTYLYQFKEETTNKSILGLYNFKFQFFSVLSSPGTPVFMRVFSPEPECEEQITTENEFSRFYIFYREIEVRRLDFALRTAGVCYILLRIAPMNSTFPEVMITLNDNTSTHIIKRTFGDPNGEETVIEKLQSSDTFGLISLQNWTLFSLRLYGEKIRLSIHSHIGTRYLLDVGHNDFAGLRYYSISSQTTAYWTLGCHPDDIIDPIPASGTEARNCSMTPDDSDYKGQLSITESGRTCLPWLSDFVNPYDKEFPDSEDYENVNFCRNVIDDYSAFCYVYDTLHNKSIRREHCAIPKCVVKPCRIYGTSVGNVENLTTTMSGRHCRKWKRANEKIKKMFSKEMKGSPKKRRLLDINAANFFCRNPNNDLGGPWCSTRDPHVEYEPCEVPDCDRPFASTILLTTNSEHKTYVKPLWRINGFKFWLKRWDEKREAGLQLTVLNEDLTTYFQIQLGAENATKLLLMYKRGKDKPILIEALAPYDFYILLAEKWTGYHLTLRPDRFVFGFTDIRDPLFNWDYETLERGFKGHGMDSFSPKYLIFEKMNAGVLAMSFDSQDSFVEIASPGRTGTYYPMNLWKHDTSFPVEEVTYNFRGEGTAVITLYNVISMGPEMKLTIGGGELLDRFSSEMTMNGTPVSVAVSHTAMPTITNDKWADIKLQLSETKVIVYHQGRELASWSNPRPLLPYYFDLEITIGNVVWILHEYPPDIDSPPVDGVWAEWGGWNCTVSCGGGRGYRRRVCAAPAPSLFGLPCEGEDLVYGLCNTYTCGDITPEVSSIINFRLKHYYFSKSLRSGVDSVSVTCYPDILELVKEQTPSYLVYWEKNGKLLSEKKPVNAVQPDRFEYFKFFSDPNDTGVYSCSLESPLVKQRPIQFVSIIVKTKSEFTHVAFRGDKFKFRCNNAIISALYDNLEQTWLHNGKIAKRYTEKYLPMLNTMEIELKTKHTGVWKCIIQSKTFHMKWQTNWLRLKVRYRSDFVKYLMEDNNYTKIIFQNFNSPKLVEITFSIFVVLVFFFTMFMTYILVLCQRALKRKIKKMYKELKISLEIEDESDTLELEAVRDNIKSAHDKMKKYRRSKGQIKIMYDELKKKLDIEDTNDSIELVPVRVNVKPDSGKKNKYRYSKMTPVSDTETSDSHTSDSDSIASFIPANQSEFSLSPVIKRQSLPTLISDRKTSRDAALDKQSPHAGLPDWKTLLGPEHDKPTRPTRRSHRKTTLGPVPDRQVPSTRVFSSSAPALIGESPLTHASDRKNSLVPVFDGKSPPFLISDKTDFLAQVPYRQSFPTHLFEGRSSLVDGSEIQLPPDLTPGSKGSPNRRSDNQGLPTSTSNSQGFSDDLSDLQAFYAARRKIKMQELGRLKYQREERIPEILQCPGEGPPKTMWVQHSQVTYDTVSDKAPLKSILKMGRYPKQNVFFRPKRRVSFSDIINESYEEAVEKISIATDLLGQSFRFSNTKGNYSRDYCSCCGNSRTDLESKERSNKELNLLTYKDAQSLCYKSAEDSSSSSSSSTTYVFSERDQPLINFRYTNESWTSSSRFCHICGEAIKGKKFTDKTDE